MTKHPLTGMTVVEYVPPPRPAELRSGNDRRSSLRGSVAFKGINLRKEQRRRTIEVPEKEGSHVTTLTMENGMTVHLHREPWDRTAADHYAKIASDFLRNASAGEYLGFPSSRHPELYTWISRHTLTRCMHFHDQTIVSPTAGRQMAGKRIEVPR